MHFPHGHYNIVTQTADPSYCIIRGCRLLQNWSVFLEGNTIFDSSHGLNISTVPPLCTPCYPRSAPATPTRQRSRLQGLHLGSIYRRYGYKLSLNFIYHEFKRNSLLETSKYTTLHSETGTGKAENRSWKGDPSSTI